jgi:hypothetical protein
MNALKAVEIFTNNSDRQLQADINNWIREKEIEDIQSVQYTAVCSDTSEFIQYSALILYTRP